MMLPLLLALAVASPADDAPRLLVLISVDQLVPEQFDRLAPALDGGLGRMWRVGWVADEALLPYAATETGPGHATLATGCLPCTHGVTGNGFFDRGARAGRYCVGDEEAGPVPAEARGGRISAANLRVPTLGDRLHALDPRARVFSVAGKDRSAVCLGGRHAAPALWWDRGRGGFMTSTAYADSLPEHVEAWNDTWEEQAAGWTWSWSHDGTPSELGADDDERAGEVPFHGQGTAMPHELPAEGAALPGMVFQTPLIDLFTLQVAGRAVEALDLGGDEATDLLAIGLSGCDVAGHAFGPYSCEITDLLLRVDDALGELFDTLDRTVGEDAWIAALTADHGVLPLPERRAARGEPGRRIGRAELGALGAAVAEALAARWPEDTPRVEAFSTGFVVADAGAHDPAEVRAVAAGAAVGFEWVEAAYTYDQLAGPARPGEDPFLAAYRASFDPERAPDVELRLTAGTLQVGLGTSHGSPYPYDQRVPLIFLGPGFPTGSLPGAVGPADVVPTLLGRLGLAPRGLDGRDLLAR